MGIDWIAIISGLFAPILAKCFSETSAEDPRAVLRAAYNPATGRIDPDLVNDCIPAVRRAVAKARRQAAPKDRKTFPRLHHADLYKIAETELLEALNADEAKLAAILHAGQQLGDDE